MILGSIFFVIAGILGVILVIQHIMLLVKLFKHGGVGLGILGICVGLFAYIWGWMKSSELGLKKLMVWYTILLILCAAFAGAGSAAFVSDPEVQKNIKVNGKPMIDDQSTDSNSRSLNKSIEQSVRDSLNQK